jgi:hypothetical protein
MSAFILLFIFSDVECALLMIQTYLHFMCIALSHYSYTVRKTNHLCSQLYLLYIHTTTCFGLHRPSSGTAYTKCQEKPLEWRIR